MREISTIDMTYSMCDNKYINSLLNNHSNCCLFDNAKAIYDVSSTRGRGCASGKITELRK